MSFKIKSKGKPTMPPPVPPPRRESSKAPLTDEELQGLLSLHELQGLIPSLFPTLLLICYFFCIMHTYF